MACALCAAVEVEQSGLCSGLSLCVAGWPPCPKDVLLQPAAQLPLLCTLRASLSTAHRWCLEPALRHLLWGLPCCGLPTTCDHCLPRPHSQLLSSGELCGHLSPTGAGPPQGPAGIACVWGLLLLLLLIQPALRGPWAMLNMTEGVDSRRNRATDGKTLMCSWTEECSSLKQWESTGAVWHPQELLFCLSF